MRQCHLNLKKLPNLTKIERLILFEEWMPNDKHISAVFASKASIIELNPQEKLLSSSEPDQYLRNKGVKKANVTNSN